MAKFHKAVDKIRQNLRLLKVLEEMRRKKLRQKLQKGFRKALMIVKLQKRPNKAKENL